MQKKWFNVNLKFLLTRLTDILSSDSLYIFDDDGDDDVMMSWTCPWAWSHLFDFIMTMFLNEQQCCSAVRLSYVPSQLNYPPL